LASAALMGAGRAKRSGARSVHIVGSPWRDGPDVRRILPREVGCRAAPSLDSDDTGSELTSQGVEGRREVGCREGGMAAWALRTSCGAIDGRGRNGGRRSARVWGRGSSPGSAVRRPRSRHRRQGCRQPCPGASYGRRRCGRRDRAGRRPCGRAVPATSRPRPTGRSQGEGRNSEAPPRPGRRGARRFGVVGSGPDGRSTVEIGRGRMKRARERSPSEFQFDRGNKPRSCSQHHTRPDKSAPLDSKKNPEGSRQPRFSATCQPTHPLHTDSVPSRQLALTGERTIPYGASVRIVPKLGGR
jgi:hypothetical protein